MDVEYVGDRTFVRVRLSRDVVDMGWPAFEGVRKALLHVGSRELVWRYCEENWGELVAVFEMLPPAYLSAAYYRSRKVPPPVWPERDPEPEHTTRDGVFRVVRPDAVTKLIKAAARSGFTVRTGYARGWARAVKIGSYRHLDSYGIALLGHGWRVHAVYARTVGAKTWEWRSIAIWGVARPQRFGYATITDLTQFVALRGAVTPAWFKGIYAREEDKR